MARADRFITETREDVVQVLDLVERAQAIAAARLQEYNAIPDKATLAGEYDWDSVDMDVSEFAEGMTALENIAGILGSDATALYRFKIELA